MTALLYAPIGLPGCGKSDVAQRLVDLKALPPNGIVSTSAMRDLVLDDPRCQTANHAVFDLVYSLAGARLRHGRSVWLDATHLTSRARSRTIGLANAIPGVQLVWVRFPADVDHLAATNAAAQSPMPQNVLDGMVNDLAAIDWATLPGHVVEASDVA